MVFNLVLCLAMTRDCDAGANYFEEHKEKIIDLLNRLMKEDDNNIVVKACVVLRHLCEAKESIRVLAVKKGSVEILGSLIKESSDETTREMAVIALEHISPNITNTEDVDKVSSN